jgi:hypothetical protein
MWTRSRTCSRRALFCQILLIFKIAISVRAGRVVLVLRVVDAAVRGHLCGWCGRCWWCGCYRTCANGVSCCYRASYQIVIFASYWPSCVVKQSSIPTSPVRYTGMGRFSMFLATILARTVLKTYEPRLVTSILI